MSWASSAWGMSSAPIESAVAPATSPDAENGTQSTRISSPFARIPRQRILGLRFPR